jgi:WXG100 protein secretion system (Wss), protein YukD
MADVRINFIHPTDGRMLTVVLDATMTGDEVIGELIANDFVPPDSQGYELAIKGGSPIPGNRTLSQAGVSDGMAIRIIPATDAGTVSL